VPEPEAVEASPELDADGKAALDADAAVDGEAPGDGWAAVDGEAPGEQAARTRTAGMRRVARRKRAVSDIGRFPFFDFGGDLMTVPAFSTGTARRSSEGCRSGDPGPRAE